MKFCKKYEEYMQGENQKKLALPGIGFKKLKKILKKCRRDLHSHHDDPEILLDLHDPNQHQISQNCPHLCPVCDGSFFPSLLNEMSAVVGSFNERAQKLLELHLASGFRRCFIRFTDKLLGNHVALIQECHDLVMYAIFNAIATRKILKKYDKIHYSKRGQAFRSQAQSMHLEILQSPWLCELMAFHINVRETKPQQNKASALFDGCSLVINEGKPSLHCELFDSIKLDIDLTCSVCLETVFDAVALTCGHIYCYMCACKTASVTIVDGLKAADHKEKCPLCRSARVYEGAVHLDELNTLLSRSCPEYWKERLQVERAERIQQAKEHWDFLCRTFVGV